MSKRKLLLADDSITIQKVVNLTFADEGIEVIAVGDGDSAMQKINESLPDLILADVNMPGLSGYEICEQIKQNAETKEIPVILLVGSFEPFDEARAESIGANDYLTKPFQSIRQLVNKVTELLEASAKATETVDTETDGDDSWQYADTKEMPHEELQTANLGDAAMDDEMIDAEHLGSEPQAETEPQNAKTQELPASYIENIEENREKEEVTYAPIDDTEETSQPETESEEPKEEVRETAFAIVSDEDAEDEFQKELPALDETEETEASPTYSESDHFSDEEEKPLYAETTESASHETPETSETVYEFADTERGLDTEEAAETTETVEETADAPQEAEEAAEETETSESADSPIYEISDETSDASETVEQTAEETEETPVSEVSEETSEETETSVADSTEENVAETAETETDEMPDSTETQEAETAETEQLEPVKEEVMESKASPILDADDNLLELPPLVKPVAATAPQVPFVSETSNNAQEGTAQEPEQVAEPTTETTAETVEPMTQTEPTTESIIKEQIVEATGSTNITPEMIEAIAQKVAEKLSDRAIREIAWEVVPQMTELIIKKMAEENEGKK